jgi:DNA invertase Pin-like site-specific DNA recombinase
MLILDSNEGLWHDRMAGFLARDYGRPVDAAPMNPQKSVGRPRAMTEAEIVLARRMLTDGVTRKIIARTLKVSLSTLYIALKPYAATLNSPKYVGRPRAMTEADIILARRMLADGVPRKIIAQTLKVSRSTLIAYLRPYGAGPHPQMRRPKQPPSSASGSVSQPEPAPRTQRRK